MNGVIPLWKPKGITSFDCVYKVRRLLNIKRVGHTGTLDPEVEGVLPICIGKATKIVTLLTDSHKVYEAEVSLGTQTTTEDQTGEIVERQAVDPKLSLEACEDGLSQFIGQIKQVPPMYSAIRVDGKRLYEYAREGIEVKRPERMITIEEIELLSSELKFNSDEDVRFSFRVKCSSGTYIRTLCVDIGKALGYPAHMSQLVRVESARFTNQDTVSLNDLAEAVENDRLNDVILPLSKSLSFIKSYTVADPKDQWRYGQGQVLDQLELLNDHEYVKIESPQQEVIAIYQKHPTKTNKMKPFKVFVD